MVGQGEGGWRNRAHFFGIAAQLMRRLLVDYARAHGAGKHGRGCKLSLADELVFGEEKAADLIAIDEALDRFAEEDRRQCRIVGLLFFGGLTEKETAEALGISTRTVKRDWSLARAWLYNQLTKGPAA